MALADQITAGENMVNNLHQGNILNDQSQIMPQMLAAQLQQQQLANQYYPTGMAAKYLQGMGQYLRGAQYLNPAMMLAKFQKDPSFQTLIANHPELAGQVNNIMRTAINGGAVGLGGFGNSPLPPALSNQMPQGSSGLGAGMQIVPGTNAVIPSNMAPSINNAIANQQPGQGIVVGGSNSPNGQPNLEPNSGIDDLTNSQSNPQSSDVANTQDVNLSEAINKTIPKAVQLQRTYSQSFDNQIQPWLSKIPEISNFASLAGKANQHMDKFSEAAGMKDSPEYNDWLAFVRTASGLAGNELRRSLGQNSSVAAQEEMKDLSDPATWNEDPQGALTRWNALLQAKKGNDQVIFQTPGQIAVSGKQAASQPAFQYATKPGTGVKLPGGNIYQLITPNGTSKVIHENDINETAKALKISPDQVKIKLGIQ